ncbi:conserved lipothrixviral protein [Sulfolobus islandicus filamentous virus 2]|uniref:Conserved lipothrixviral protein n=1 Tax=Sulfolobus islandicus filamentous virus 2 TaxID=1902331 RepID=A0A1D8BJ76_SIFV|nr:conserved lipothrixviral protein [Sulfolobus islandicus filamentous virus 2]
MENRGIRIAERYGYKLVPNFFNLFFILDNWNNIPIGKTIVSLYNYRQKDFDEIFKKYDQNIGIATINYTTIHIIKHSNEFEIIVYNVDSIHDHKSRHLLRLFLGNTFIFRKGKVYLHGIVIGNLIKSHDLQFKVKKINLIRVRSLFDNNIVSYYPKKELIRNSIILGKGANDSIYVINEINNKRVLYYVKRIRKIPRLNRIALKNHKLQYQFFKTLLQKGILQKEILFPIVPLKSLRISKTTSWKFSPLYVFNGRLINTNIYARAMNPVLIDYDYDEANQVLLKFADELYHSVLCGLDYKNMLWCIALPPITKFWKIKDVYKYAYDLDNETKVFNY